jgi:hypothetical protein
LAPDATEVAFTVVTFALDSILVVVPETPETPYASFALGTVIECTGDNCLKEDLLATVTALGNVLGDAFQNNAGDSWQTSELRGGMLFLGNCV